MSDETAIWMADNLAALSKENTELKCAVDRLTTEQRDVVKNSDKYKLALELALILLSRYEPGDSRAVSDEFVAMAAIHCDAKTSDDCVELVRKAIVRESALEI